MSGPPLLLVSVRDAKEAEQALLGGADIVDIKEPNRGALGMASLTTIQSISEVEFGGTPLSVAAGEAREWLPRDESTAESDNSRDQLLRSHGGIRFEPESSPFTYCKLGLAGLAAAQDWQSRWQQARELAKDVLPARDWVAVAYADFKLANSPLPSLIVDEAIRSGFAGFLIDTYGKTGGGLLEFAPPDVLREFINRLHDHGLFAALAGQVDRSSLARLLPLKPDVIAIRTAACRNHDRNGCVDADVIRTFKRSMIESATV